jgi:hypothetical protein
MMGRMTNREDDKWGEKEGRKVRIRVGEWRGMVFLWVEGCVSREF